MKRHVHIKARTVVVLFLISGTVTAGTVPVTELPEQVYRGELVSYPGPWAFTLGKSAIILVSDEQLEALSNPDQPVNISLGTTPDERSLRQICEQARSAGHRTLIVAFDHFFSQYRKGQEGKPRRLMPDSPEYVERIAAVSRFAERYGLGLELSLLSPLEIGPGYVQESGESGIWMHYRKGVRDPESGTYSVQLWRQRQWTNNKGTIEIKDAGVRVFAFRQRRIPSTPYLVVRPDEIVEITAGAQVEVFEGTGQSNHAIRVRIHGTGSSEAKGFDRVLVVQMYRTPEMDYFSDKALPYLERLVDRYVDAGVKLNALYSDEMHIQQDWGYYNHHDHGAFALRYITPALAHRFAESYGESYHDLAKYLVYFCHGQEDTATDLTAKQDMMHVFGDTPEAIWSTALFRARYYRLLQNTVVDVFCKAKHHLEGRLGHRLESRAHATWAESPTCDAWEYNGALRARPYEYTSSFIWSNTVHQAASACYDYFRWGDFLAGTGNDHAEGGWLDRNYCGLALACSTGILNEIPYSYAAHWGMPREVSRRRQALVNTYGASAEPFYGMVQGMQHRDVDVLMLYPLDLVAVDERFGSWMNQYGYANYVTAEKLLERGRVVNGAIEMAGRRFTELVTLFEPFPSVELLSMLEQLAGSGGRVIWTGPPPVLLSSGDSALPRWQDLAGVTFQPGHNAGIAAPGLQVHFENTLDTLRPMTILTGYLVDRVYPITLRGDTQPIARVKQLTVGSHRPLGHGGSFTFLGFRPRDDQSQSMGYETRYWFDTLRSLGAYPATGRFEGTNDNPEYLSRTTDHLVCRFPNGAVAVAPHLRHVEECWPGGFARDAQQDQASLKHVALPSEEFMLGDFRAQGHTVSYTGQAMTFRVNENGDLIAFCGKNCKEISIDGRTTVFADQPMPLVAWAPVDVVRRIEGGAISQMRVHGTGKVRIPFVDTSIDAQVFAEGSTPGEKGEPVACKIEDGVLELTIDPASSNRWLYVVPGIR